MGLVGDDDLGAGQGQVECRAGPEHAGADDRNPHVLPTLPRRGGHGAAEDIAPVHPGGTAAPCDRG